MDNNSSVTARPSLEYQYAFDLCALEAHQVPGTTAILASAPFYARELLKRLDGRAKVVAFIRESDRTPAGLNELLGPEVTDSDIRPWHSFQCQAQSVIWAEPLPNDKPPIVDAIEHILSPGGFLSVVSSGWLALRFLPEWLEGSQHKETRPARLQRVLQWLRPDGFQIEALYGFHGPRSALWGYASRLMERVGRPDLADRYQFRMRASYVSRGQWALLAPVRVMRAKRSATG